VAVTLKMHNVEECISHFQLFVQTHKQTNKQKIKTIKTFKLVTFELDTKNQMTKNKETSFTFFESFNKNFIFMIVSFFTNELIGIGMRTHTFQRLSSLQIF
jgi:hypothetical protein